MTTSRDQRLQAAGMVGIAAAAGAAFWIGEGFEAAVPPFLIILAFALAIILFRSRSDTVQNMSGLGDERTRAVYQRAVAFAGNVLAFAIPGWWLVTVAQGEPNETLPVVAVIFALSWIAAVAWYSRRG